VGARLDRWTLQDAEDRYAFPRTAQGQRFGAQGLRLGVKKFLDSASDNVAAARRRVFCPLAQHRGAHDFPTEDRQQGGGAEDENRSFSDRAGQVWLWLSSTPRMAMCECGFVPCPFGSQSCSCGLSNFLDGRVIRGRTNGAGEGSRLTAPAP